MSDDNVRPNNPGLVDLMSMQNGMDELTDGITKVIAQTSPEILVHPDDFYVVHVRTEKSWNLATGRESEWFVDVLAAHREAGGIEQSEPC